jgi:AcrR family transcriptional regulator
MGIIERREREKSIRRSLILECATKVFSKYGFDRATMEMIAKEAELSKGAIYLYFADKDVLFKSIALKAFLEIEEKIRKALEKEKDPIKRIQLTIDSLLEVCEMKRDLLGIFFHLVQASEKAHYSIHSMADEMGPRFHELFRFAIKPAFDKGLTREGVPLDVLSAYFEIAVSGTLAWILRLSPEAFDRKTTSAMLLNLFTNGAMKNAL